MPISVLPKLYTARGTRHQMTYLFVYLATKLHPDCASWLGVRLRVRPGGRGRVDTWGSRLRRLCFACSSPLLMDDFPLSPEELAIFLRSTPLLHQQRTWTRRRKYKAQVLITRPKFNRRAQQNGVHGRLL